MPEHRFIPASAMPVCSYPPANGKCYTLQELQHAVGGYIEVVHLGYGHILVINEEGKLHNLPRNVRATQLFHHAHPHLRDDYIVGPAVFCDLELMQSGEEEQ